MTTTPTVASLAASYWNPDPEDGGDRERAPERTPQELADLALLMNPAAPTKPNGDGRQPPPGGGDKATGKDQQQ